MKYLVVDPSTTTRRAIVRALRPLECEEYREAATLADGLASFDESVNVVIVGWDPPAFDGLGLARELRAQPAGATLPIVLVTSRNEKARVLEAVEAGVNGYFLRPFSPDQLRERVRALTTVEESGETEEAKAA